MTDCPWELWNGKEWLPCYEIEEGHDVSGMHWHDHDEHVGNVRAESFLYLDFYFNEDGVVAQPDPGSEVIGIHGGHKYPVRNRKHTRKETHPFKVIV